VSKDLDLAKLSKMLGVLGSAGDGEVANAGRLADRLVRDAGMVWSEFIESFKAAETATAAAAALLAENSAMRAELDELRSTGGAIAPWQNIESGGSRAQTGALWALDLHAQGAVWLSPDFEVPFLTRCSTWTGRLTERMQPVFDQIIARVASRTGLMPPP
jgi:hypothetical protein